MKDPLQIAKEALASAIETEKRSRSLVASIGPAIIDALRPVLDEILQVNRQSAADTKEAMAKVKVDAPDVQIPAITIPEINVPTPQVTVNIPDIKVPEARVTVDIPKIEVPTPQVTVNVPEIKIPDLRWPDAEMPITGWVQLMGVDLKHPLPVQLRDADGKPVHLGGGSPVIVGGGGGGQGVKILNLASEPVPISGTISATFSADFGQGATGSQTLRTVAATDSIQSVNIVSGSSAGTEYADGTARGTATGTLLMLDDGTNIQSARGGTGNSDSRTLRVVHASDAIVSVNIVSGSSSGATGQGDAASATRVVIAGNSDSSVSVNAWGGNAVTVGTGYQDNALRVVHATDAVVSVNIVSGSSSGATGQGDAASALRVVVAGNSDASVSVNAWNGNAVTVGTGYQDNALRVVVATDSVASVSLANAALNQGDAATALRVVVAGNSDASVSATQVGTWTVKVQDSLGSTITSFGSGDSKGLAVAIVDASGNQITSFGGGTQYAEGTAASTYTGTALMWKDSEEKARPVTSANPLPVSGSFSASLSAATGQGDGSAALRVIHAGDSTASVNVLTFNGATPAAGLNETNTGVLRVVHMTDSVVSVNIVSGSSSGPVGQGDGASALRVIHAGDSTASVNILTINGTTPTILDVGATAATSSTLRVVEATDSIGSTQTHLIARTTNPTAIADGSTAFATSDKLGRALNRPVQVRELLATAYVSLTNGSETTLATAAAAGYLDLVYILASNTSTAAQTIDIRAVSGGNIIMSLAVPGSGTTGVALPVPIPQDATGNAWTADNADVTNSTVYVSALFSKET